MRTTLMIISIGLGTAQSMAALELLPCGPESHIRYDYRTGEIHPGNGPIRIGSPIWSNNVPTGYFAPIHDGAAAYPEDSVMILDWGDIAEGTTAGGFSFSYFGLTPNGAADRGDMGLAFYTEENGFNAFQRVAMGAYRMVGLPGLPADPGGAYSGWLVRVDLQPLHTFRLIGPDLDGDRLADFGWQQWVPYESWPEPSLIGPAVRAPSASATGEENVFDLYVPITPDDHNSFMYNGSFWFGGTPWAGFEMVLYDTQACCACPGLGASGNGCSADIVSWDESWCKIDLADLAKLLTNYGSTGAMTHDDGDLEPPGGDGDVDLADLATLLVQYGDDCTQ